MGKSRQKKLANSLKQTSLHDFFNCSRNDNSEKMKTVKIKRFYPKRKAIATITISDSEEDENDEFIELPLPIKEKKTEETLKMKDLITISKSTPLCKTIEKLPRVLQRKDTPRYLNPVKNKNNLEAPIEVQTELINDCNTTVSNNLILQESNSSLNEQNKAKSPITPTKRKISHSPSSPSKRSPISRSSLSLTRSLFAEDSDKIPEDEKLVEVAEEIQRPIIKVKSNSQLFNQPNTIDVSENALNKDMEIPTKFEFRNLSEEHISMTQLHKIITYVSETPNLYSLLFYEEKIILKQFFEMPHNHQFICFRLFTRQSKWYNIENFLRLIKLDIDTNLLEGICLQLANQHFVDLDYSKEPVIDLLNQLPADDVKAIFNSFKIKPKKNMRKDDYIEAVLKHCNSQTTLTSTKTSDLILKDRIKEKMGLCLKLDYSFHNTLFRLHLLYSFANPELIKPADLYMYMRRLDTNEVTLPSYTTDFSVLFHSQEEFFRYSTAMEFYYEYILAKENKNTENMMKIVRAVFKDLKENLNARYNDGMNKPNFLRNKCAGSVYVRILSSACDDFASNWELVKEYLKFLLKQDQYLLSKRGVWFNHLALIAEKYEHNMEEAGQIIVEALCDPRISVISQYELSTRAERLIRRKSGRPSEETMELLTEVILPLDGISEFPFSVTEARCHANYGLGQRKLYIESLSTSTVDTNLKGVEDIAIDYYTTQGYPSGIHCEGALFTTLFCLLFWDIIYEVFVPGTFISEIQYVPLDLRSKDFYENRKCMIDNRLFDIDSGWSELELQEFLLASLRENSNKLSLASPTITSDPNIVINAINCIPRDVSSKILRRLIMDYRSYHSGMPDLFVWNSQTKMYKFVEVKSENDKLSMKQKLWLQFFKTIGANAEVCHVNTIGSRKKKVK